MKKEIVIKKIIINPFTRVEGRLAVEVEIYNGKVIDARLKAGAFRGFELILEGREPLDALYLTQRICGVCSPEQAIASAVCVENAALSSIPSNAQIIRNLIQGANYLHSHLFHFYHSAILDYVRGFDMPPYLPRYEGDYRFSEKINQTYMEHYWEALRIIELTSQAIAIWGGKSPHQIAITAGGVTERPTVDKIIAFVWRVRQIRDFIENVYIPDVLAIADVYKDYKQMGRGYGNFLTYGSFDLDDEGKNKLFKKGVYINGKDDVLTQDKITEHVYFSWYKDETSAKHPLSGVTVTDLEKEGAYSFVKAARYEGKSFEVGSLARMWINGVYNEGISVIDRHVARAFESKKLAYSVEEWAKELKIGEPIYTRLAIPEKSQGVGSADAAAGALGHWINIENSKIANYQIISPSGWNVSPRDDTGKLGPIEEALIGTSISDSDNPFEVVRIVRSFNICLGCAVH